MAVISKLSVGIFADTKPFAKSMNAAAKSVKKFKSGFGGVGKGISAVGGAFLKVGKLIAGAGIAFAKFAASGALVAAAGIAFFTRQALKSIDATAKLAKQTGFATESLAAYGLAAELAGVDNATFEKSLQKFNRTLGEAKLGLGEGATAFKQLGLSQKEVSKLSPDDALKLVANRLSKVEDKAIQAALAQDLFGRAGVKLIPLLSKGAAGLNQFQAEAVRLGIAVSAVDSAKVEAANDAFTLMGKSVKGVFNTIAVAVAPTLQAFATAATNAFVSFRQNTLPIIFNFIKNAVKGFRSFLKIALPILINFGKGIFDVFTAIGDIFSIAFEAIGTILGFFISDIGKGGGEVETFAERIKTAMTFIRFVFKNFKTFVDTAMQSVIKSITNVILALFRLAKRIPGVASAFKGLGIDSLENIIKEVNEGSGAIIEENTDKLTKDFVKFQKKSRKEIKKTTQAGLKFFDQLVGFAEIGFEGLKLDPIEFDPIEVQAVKPQELKSLQKGSVEAFKALNKTGKDEFADQKKLVKQGEKREEQLKKLPSAIAASVGAVGLTISYTGP